MSILNLHHRIPTVPGLGDFPEPSRHPTLSRGPVKVLARLVAVSWAAFWTTAVAVPVLAARLIGWFAAEPRRIHAALLGVTASVATGVIAGLAVGAVAVRVVGVLLGLVREP